MTRQSRYSIVFVLGIIDVFLYSITMRHSPVRQYGHFDSSSPIWLVFVTLEIVLLIAMGVIVLGASRKGK